MKGFCGHCGLSGHCGLGGGIVEIKTDELKLDLNCTFKKVS